MNARESQFLNLLLPSPVVSLLNDLNPHEIEWFFETSNRHYLFALLFSQIERLKEHVNMDFYREFTSSYKRLFLSSAGRSAVQERVEKDVLDALSRDNIPAVTIKGSSLARRIYGDPNSRTSADIDILIKRADAERVERVLLSIGLQPEEDMPLRYCLSRIHHATYYDPKTKQGIEIHWNFGVPYFFNITSEDIWKEIVIEDNGEYRLKEYMLLIMLLIHHHSHNMRELRILVDFLWSLYALRDDLRKDDIIEKINRFGLQKVASITVLQIQNLWPGYLREAGLDEIADLLHEYVPKKWLTEYFSANRIFEDNNSLYKDKLFARFLLEKYGKIFLSFYKTIFPPRDAIEALYDGKGNLFYNYMRFILWRIKDWIK